MRVDAVEVRVALRDAPVNAVGVTNAWAAPTVAHASTSFIVAGVEVEKRKIWGVSREWCARSALNALETST